MPPPRIPPLSKDEWDAATEELLSMVRTPSGEDLNIFATLARHPKLLRKWLPFGGLLLRQSALNARQREILILRTAWRCGVEYEFVHHTEIARTEGLKPREIAATTDPDVDQDCWSNFDQALLGAVDELHERSVISDVVWDVLAGELDARALIEVCMLIGHYHMVGFTVNSLGVELEEGVGDA